MTIAAAHRPKLFGIRLFCRYILSVVITWDEPKRLANLEKHGIDFADLDNVFLGSAVVLAGHSGRYRAINRLRGMPVSVVLKPLGTEALSIVSARPANVKERKRLHG